MIVNISHLRDMLVWVVVLLIVACFDEGNSQLVSTKISCLKQVGLGKTKIS